MTPKEYIYTKIKEGEKRRRKKDAKTVER